MKTARRIGQYRYNRKRIPGLIFLFWLRNRPKVLKTAPLLCYLLSSFADFRAFMLFLAYSAGF